MREETTYVVVLSTVPSVEIGLEIAHDLVENLLAACVNIIPRIMSVYEWEGEIREDEEALLIIKTRLMYVDNLIERIMEIHPYDIPEVIALPVVEGSSEYLEWIDSVIGPMIPPEDDEE